VKAPKLPGKIRAAESDVERILLAAFGKRPPMLCILATLFLKGANGDSLSDLVLTGLLPTSLKDRMLPNEIEESLSLALTGEFLAIVKRRDWKTLEALSKLLRDGFSIESPFYLRALVAKKILQSKGKSLTPRAAQEVFGGSLDSTRKKLQRLGFPLNLRHGIDRLRVGTSNRTETAVKLALKS